MNAKTISNELATAILEAAVLGTIAFKAGQKAIPCYDARLMELVGLHDGCAIHLLKAWTNSWHAANLAA